MVHCETTTGILNDLSGVSKVVRDSGKRFIVDAMSSFGALPISSKDIYFDAVVASSNKCLEGVPGVGFSLVRRDVLEESKGNAHSLVLDLHDQWKYMNETEQWRWTPSTHAVAAFAHTLELYAAEGGQKGRGARYRRNWEILTSAMAKLGCEFYVPLEHQAPIIVTILNPADPRYSFAQLYDRMKQKGYIIYPGKLTKVDTFRIGCVGQISNEVMNDAVQLLGQTMIEMGVTNFSPRK